jgi:hypothetical protein
MMISPFLSNGPDSLNAQYLPQSLAQAMESSTRFRFGPPLSMLLSCFLLCLPGCSSVGAKVSGWLSSNVDAIGVIDGRILLGQVNFPGEREGTIQLQSAGEPGLTCFGLLRYTSSTTGIANFSCNDGRSALLPFQAFSTLSGAGRTALGSGEFALTYGLTPDKAASYLAVPASQLVPAGSNAPAPRASP